MDTLTAYHEAGHSALSPLMGELPDRATIRADGDSGGHTALLGVEAHAIFMAALRGRTEADRDRVMSYLVGLAAGAAAESLRMNRGVRRDFIDETSWETFGGSKDYKQLQYFVAGKARGLEDVTADDIVSEAFDLLEQPTVWGSVERVAKDLIAVRPAQLRGQSRRSHVPSRKENEVMVTKNMFTRDFAEADVAVEEQEPARRKRINRFVDMFLTLGPDVVALTPNSTDLQAQLVEALGVAVGKWSQVLAAEQQIVREAANLAVLERGRVPDPPDEFGPREVVERKDRAHADRVAGEKDALRQLKDATKSARRDLELYVVKSGR